MVLRHSANIPANPTAHLSGWFQRHTKLRVVHRWLQLTGTVLTYRHAPQSSAEWIVDLRDCTVSAGRRAKEIVLIRPACKPLSLYAVSMDELKVWFSEMKRVSDVSQPSPPQFSKTFNLTVYACI